MPDVCCVSLQTRRPGITLASTSMYMYCPYMRMHAHVHVSMHAEKEGFVYLRTLNSPTGNLDLSLCLVLTSHSPDASTSICARSNACQNVKLGK